LEFSSTETYANRYDLDEIDVFLEGDSSNPMFFNISGLPQQLSYGKHYFNISLLSSNNTKYRLRPGSRILFEFKSENNVVIKSDVSDINQRNGVATCFVEILNDPLRTYEEISDGQGSLTIVGSLENKENSIPLIPNQYLGAMNYRCSFPIQITKNILNADSPFILQSEHKTSTIQGQFSFTKASISPMKNSAVGLVYNPTSGNPSVSIVSTTKGRAIS
tara:strand:- start:426 stop:1082 length:657 start_codon:yes stop_codon:yes gene_type:complete